MTHFQNADKLSKNNKIGVIAQNNEQFLFSFECLSVKDTFGLLTASLDKLVSMIQWLLCENWKDN